jgi:2,7-dihydroxy-5-methyl-1-naphthoate 7-O-methyltransferase
MSQAAGPSRLSDESRPVSPIAAVRAANFFEPLPAGAGGYILSRVVHDWDDDDACRILRNCADAARPNGKVFVIEDTEDVESVSTEMDLRMFAYCGGRERSLDRLTDLAREAGLAFGTVTSARHRSIVEFLPDQTAPQTS